MKLQTSSIYPDSFPMCLYMENSKLPSFTRKLEESKAIIHKAFEEVKDWYVAWSGGKDSTVLAHLVNSICPGIEIWSEKDDCDFPNELDYVKLVAKRYNFNLKLVMPGVSLWEEIKSLDIDICEALDRRGTLFCDKYFFSMVEKQEALHDGVFLGLRRQESRARQLNFASRGVMYRRKNGKWTCNPLTLWSATDIFSYLVTNDIPILDIYFKTKFLGSPDNIRKSWMLPSDHSRKGFCCWLKYYYPEFFRRLAIVHPRVKSYV